MDNDRSDNKSIKVFVARPFSNLGENANWDSAQEIKEEVLQLIEEKLKAKLKTSMNRDVTVYDELNRRQSGDIYKSMFNEAKNADVFIADLTGANPNVYLELGVRWALQKSVTILICQSKVDVKFNVKNIRYFEYTPKGLNRQCDKIVAAIQNGLETKDCDSPILDATNIEWMEHEEAQKLRIENKSLKEEVDRLRTGKAERLLRKARNMEGDEKLKFLEDEVQKNPDSIELLLELGMAYRKIGNFGESEKTLTEAKALDPEHSVVQRELGVTFKKSGNLDDSIKCLEKAARLEPGDEETWSNLGGALRSLATCDKNPEDWEESTLSRAYECYLDAQKINPFNLYAGLNVARTGVALARDDQERFQEARKIFETQCHLALYVVSNDPENYWLRFDLADCFMFMGKIDSAKEEVIKGLALVPENERLETISSVLSPLEGFSRLGIPDSDTKKYLGEIIAMLHDAIGTK